MRKWLNKSHHQTLFSCMDPNENPAGELWSETLIQELGMCRAVIALRSQSSIQSRWCFFEVTHARALGKHVIPVKIDQSQDPDLENLQHVDLTGDREAGYFALGAALGKAGLAPDFPWNHDRSPYPGLAPFEEQDAAVYFGRERDIAQGLETLDRARWLSRTNFVMILGASGIGKSSLLRAGLLPRLKEDKERWIVLDPFRPGENPLQDLRIVLERAYRKLISASSGAAPANEDFGQAIDRLVQASADPSRRPGLSLLVEVTDHLRSVGASTEAVVLAIDQFEELLGKPAGHPATQFLSMISEAVQSAGGTILVLATMRSDFLAVFQQSPILRGLQFDPVSLSPLSSDDIRRTIEAPAQLANMVLEAKLVDALMADAPKEETLPLLAYTLRQLHSRAHQTGELTLADYKALGGVEAVVRKTADELMASENLSPEMERHLRVAFLKLVRVSEDGKQVGRAVQWSELPPEAHKTLRRFVDHRLLKSNGDSLEVAHDALFRTWPTFRNWLLESQKSQELRREIEYASLTWKRSGRSDDYLWKGSRLARVKEMREDLFLPPAEQEFIGASEAKERETRIREQEARERETEHLRLVAKATQLSQRRLRITLAIIATAAGIVFFLMISARQAATEARDAKLVAVASERMRQDPTRAGLTLLELRNPETTRLATTRMREVLRHGLIEQVFPHSGPVTTASLSENGRRIVTASKIALVWEYRDSGQAVQIACLDGGPFTAVAFNVDGAMVVAGSEDGVTQVWEIEAAKTAETPDDASPPCPGGAKKVGDPLRHSKAISAVSFSRDGRWILTASEDGFAKLWDAQKRSAIELKHGGPVLAATFSPDSKRILTASQDGFARIWDLEGKVQFTLQHGDYVEAAVFSPDGKYVATAGRDGVSKLMDVETGTLLCPSDRPGETASPFTAIESGGPIDPLLDVAFSSDSEFIATGSRDSGVVSVRRTKCGQVDRWSYDSAVRKVRFLPPQPGLGSPNGLRVAVGFEDGDVVVREYGGAETWLKGHSKRINSLQIGSNGRILTGSEDGSALIWNAEGLGDSIRLSAPEVPDAVAFSQDGHLLMAASKQGARIWRLEPDGKEVETLGTPADADLSTAALSPDGGSVIAGFTNGEVAVWKAGSSTPLEPKHRGPVRTTTFLADGNRAATVSTDGVRIWDLGSRKSTGSCEQAEGEPAISLASCGRLMVTGHDSGEVRLWDTSRGCDPTARLKSGDSRITALAFSPDCKTIAAAGDDGSIQCFDPRRPGRPTCKPGKLPTRVLGLAFNEDGSQLEVFTSDRNNGASALRVWDVSESTPDLSSVPNDTVQMTEGATQAGFSPTRDRLATVSGASIRIWLLSAARLRSALSEKLKFCLEISFRHDYLGETLQTARQMYCGCERRSGRVVDSKCKGIG